MDRTCSSWAVSTSAPEPRPASVRLNPVTGSTTPAGRLAVATPGAAAAILNGRAFLFGGGDQTGVARGQRPFTGRPTGQATARRASGQATAKPAGETLVQQVAGRGTATAAAGCPRPGPGWPR